MRYWELLQEDNSKKIQELKDQIADVKSSIKSQEEKMNSVYRNFGAPNNDIEIKRLSAERFALVDILNDFEERLENLEQQEYYDTGKIAKSGDKHNLKIFNNSELIDKIRKSCSDIIELCNRIGLYLYRGIKNNDGSAVIHGLPRVDRKTLNTPIKWSTRLDDILKKDGCVALRSNSIFCTSSSILAEIFGDVYVIFPVNGFNYTWTDFYDFPYKGRDSESKLPLETIMGMDDEQLLKYISPKTTNLETAIKTKRETLISAEYYAIQPEFLSMILDKEVVK